MPSPQAPDAHKLSIEAIDKGLPKVKGKSQPDPKDMEELRSAQLQNELTSSKIEDRKADREMRKTYAGRILCYLEIYSITVGIFIIAAGFNLFGFSLPVEILATLVGSTAIAAIGLVGFIARGLFRSPPEN